MNIRKGNPEDMKSVLGLIQELAIFEKEPEAVVITEDDLIRDGFGEKPLFHVFVAEIENEEKQKEIVGIALYYYRYSTWKGKRLYLEDIVVTESERGNGAGKMLFDRVMAKCLEDGCTGMMWQVLDWNEPAINFYKKYGAYLEAGWLNAHLQDYEIRKMLS